MKMFTFTGVIVREKESYAALCPELDIASEGLSPEEAKSMLLEAATLHLHGAIEDGVPFLSPIPVSEDPRNTSVEKIVETFYFTVDVDIRAHV